MERGAARRICGELEELESRGAGLGALLQRAVSSLHEASNRFDWTGIYELHPDGALRLGPFVGADTEHVVITVGQGVCGSAVANKCNMNVPDVSKATNYLACSSTTRSELVVLIRRGDRIYAQIDIDSHQIDAFHDDIVDQVEELADWLAIAYEKRARATGGVAAVGTT
jgi:GAF domain-containing protein